MKTGLLAPEDLRRIPAFAGFSDEDCRELLSATKVHEFEPGQYVLKEGGTSQRLWVLLSGSCEVRKHADDQDDGVLLATLEPYASFGEMSFFHQAPHSASVRAKEQVRLLCLERTKCDELGLLDSKAGRRLAINIVEILAHRMRRMGERVAELMGTRSRAPVSDMMRLREKLFESWQL